MINYPNKKKINNLNISKTNNKISDFKNRGMNFEDDINSSNDYYAINDIAYIYKKPTPIKVSKVLVQTNKFDKKHKITEAYYEKKSTTDYNGLYKGHYIDFEAKNTKNSSFNIKSNLHSHQYEHLVNIHNHNGIAFILVNFQKYNEIYLLEIKEVILFLEKSKNKSLIPYDYFVKNGYVVQQKLNPRIDYIDIVDKLL